MRWISVKDELPERTLEDETSGWKLTYSTTRNNYLLSYFTIDKEWWNPEDYAREVTHWMPLPEPPKEK